MSRKGGEGGEAPADAISNCMLELSEIIFSLIRQEEGDRQDDDDDGDEDDDDDDDDDVEVKRAADSS